MKNIYLHGIANMAFAEEEKESIEAIEEILTQNYLLSRIEQGKLNNVKEGYNGIDRISLCDYDTGIEVMSEFYHPLTSYEMFINQSLSFIFPKKNINAIFPIIVSNNISEEELFELQTDPQFEGEYFTDLPDEVQVKDKLSLDYMEGITIPIEYIFQQSKSLEDATKKIIYYLNNLDELLKKYKRKNHIYNLDDFQEIKNTNDIERALKKI